MNAFVKHKTLGMITWDGTKVTVEKDRGDLAAMIKDTIDGYLTGYQSGPLDELKAALKLMWLDGGIESGNQTGVKPAKKDVVY